MKPPADCGTILKRMIAKCSVRNVCWWIKQDFPATSDLTARAIAKVNITETSICSQSDMYDHHNVTCTAW